jgi:hypothetical protein
MFFYSMKNNMNITTLKNPTIINNDDVILIIKQLSHKFNFNENKAMKFLKKYNSDNDSCEYNSDDTCEHDSDNSDVDSDYNYSFCEFCDSINTSGSNDINYKFKWEAECDNECDVKSFFISGHYHGLNHNILEQLLYLKLSELCKNYDIDSFQMIKFNGLFKVHKNELIVTHINRKMLNDYDKKYINDVGLKFCFMKN